MEGMRRSGADQSFQTANYSSKRPGRDLEQKIIRSSVLQEPGLFLSPKCSVDAMVPSDLNLLVASQKREVHPNLSFAAENNSYPLAVVQTASPNLRVLKQKPSFVSRLEDAKSNCTRLEDSYEEEHPESHVHQSSTTKHFILQHKVRDSDEQSEYVNEVSTESTGKRDSYPLKDDPKHIFKGASKKSFKTASALKNQLQLPESLKRQKSMQKGLQSGLSMRKSQEKPIMKSGSRDHQNRHESRQYSDKMKLLINKSRESKIEGTSQWNSLSNHQHYRDRASAIQPQARLIDYSASLADGHNLYGMPAASEVQYNSLGASFEDSRAHVPNYYYQNSKNQSAKSMIMSNIDCRSQVHQTNPFKENFTSHKKGNGLEPESFYMSNAEQRMSGISTDVGRENKHTAARTPKKTASPQVRLGNLKEGNSKQSVASKGLNMHTFKLNMTRNKIGLTVKPNTTVRDSSTLIRRGSVEDTVSPFKSPKSFHTSKKLESNNWSKAKKGDSKQAGENYTYLRKKKTRKEGNSNNLGNLTKGDVIEILKLHKNLQMKIKVLEGQVTQFF
jgi:hypothetical protein